MPDREQQRTMRELQRVADRIDRDEEQRTALIAKANELGVPLKHIARAASVTTKTVYRKLGHPMR